MPKTSPVSRNAELRSDECFMGRRRSRRWFGLAGRGGDVKRIYLDRTRPGTHMHTKITPRRILLGGLAPPSPQSRGDIKTTWSDRTG